MRRAVYAGTFDPPTNGHKWMIHTGASLFDELYVAISNNPDKKTMFRVTTRCLMIAEIVSNLKNVTICSIENEYLVRWAANSKCNFLLRGIRNQADFAYEQTMANVNAEWEPDITTVFLKSPKKLEEVSSSFVKGLVGFNGWEQEVQKFVSPGVSHYLKEEHNRKQAEIEGRQ